MSASNPNNRSFRWIWLALLVLLLLGVCGFTSVLAAAAGVRVAWPGLTGNGIDARVVSVKSAANHQMEIAIQMEGGTRENDRYYAEVNGRRYSCASSEQDAAVLLCVGPAFAPGSTVEFRLFNARDEAVFGTTLALLEAAAQSEGRIDVQANSGESMPAKTPTGDQTTISLNGESQGNKFTILSLLGSLLTGGSNLNANADADMNAGVRTHAEANANANIEADNTGIRSDLEADVNMIDTPASACLFGWFCLEVDTKAEATVD